MAFERQPAERHGSPSPARLDHDDAELEASGYKREMPRQFSMFSLLALAYALICTWNGFASVIVGGLKQGSSAGSIFMLVPAALVMGVVSLGMAELTSAFPVAGGQYYWAFLLSPPKWAPFLSYFAAVISVIGAWLGSASACYFISGLVLSLAEFIQPDYEIQQWHKCLVYLAVVLASILINIFGARFLPAFNRFVFFFSMATFVFTITAMLVGSYPTYNTAQWVFTDTTISSGWSSHSYAGILCFVNSLYGFLGTDAGVHMTEEIPNPSTNVPKAVVFPILIGLVTVLPFASTCMFVIKDIDQLLTSPTDVPLIQLYWQATGSQTMTVLLIVAFTICFFACSVACVTGSSRILWSAARDECFPRSDLWAKIHPGFEMPLNAVLLQAGFSALCALVFLGSEAAFSTMVGAPIIFMVVSYVVPQTILLFTDRNIILPEREFDLGRLGFCVNLFATAAGVFLTIASCLPTEYPITASNMNYNSAVTVALLACIWLGWIFDRKAVFKGPKIDKKVLADIRHRYLHASEAIDERTPLISSPEV